MVFETISPKSVCQSAPTHGCFVPRYQPLEIVDTQDAPALIESTVLMPWTRSRAPGRRKRNIRNFVTNFYPCDLPSWDSVGLWRSTHGANDEHIREDTILPLREAVGRIRNKPWAREQNYGSTVSIHNNFQFVGFTFANSGVAARIQFSLARAGLGRAASHELLSRRVGARRLTCHVKCVMVVLQSRRVTV